MKAAILVGGLGTRLRSVVADRPKPLAEVAGKSFLVYLLEWLRSFGFADVVLCAGYRWEDIQAALGDGASLGMNLEYSVEGVPLGTAGALRHARPFLRDRFLALNGDSFVDLDLGKLVAFHAERKPEATLALVRMSDAAAFGSVDTDDQHRVVAFREKAAAGAGDGWINAGVYVLEPIVLDRIPDGRPVSLEREVFPSMVRQGAALLGFRTEGYFVDIGTPEAYVRSQHELCRLRHGENQCCDAGDAEEWSRR